MSEEKTEEGAITQANSANGATDPYLKVEFEEFIKAIGDAKIGEWQIYAKVLGVSRNTITRWKQHPLAKAAITNAIAVSMAKMVSAGEGDWRMHREKLKMLGVEDEQKVKLETSVGEVIEELERTNQNDDMAREAKKQMVENKQPVQNP